MLLHVCLEKDLCVVCDFDTICCQECFSGGFLSVDILSNNVEVQS